MCDSVGNNEWVADAVIIGDSVGNSEQVANVVSTCDNAGNSERVADVVISCENDEVEYNFDTVHNLDLYGCELAPTVREGMRAWNMTVQYWLATYIYKRVPVKASSLRFHILDLLLHCTVYYWVLLSMAYVWLRREAAAFSSCSTCKSSGGSASRSSSSISSGTGRVIARSAMIVMT